MATQTRAMDMSDLKDLEPISKRLNAASNELNQALQTIQEHLNSLAIGLEVWGPQIESTDWSDILDRDSEPTGSRQYHAVELGYGRYGDGWALLIRTRRFVQDPSGEDDVYEDEGSQLLLKAPRSLRVAAVQAIPALLDEIKDRAAKVIESVERAKAIADSLNK